MIIYLAVVVVLAIILTIYTSVDDDDYSPF